MVLKLIDGVAKGTTVGAPAHGKVGPESSLASLRLPRRPPEASWEEEKSAIEVRLKRGMLNADLEIIPPRPMKT